MNNNLKRDMNLFSCKCVTRYTKQDCSKGPVYVLNSENIAISLNFVNPKINFWIVVRVFHVQLGLTCVPQMCNRVFRSKTCISEQSESSQF